MLYLFLQRHLRARYNNGKYVAGTSRSSVIHVDRIIFSPDDLIWAMDNVHQQRANSFQNINVDMIARPSSRRNTINAKLMQKVCILFICLCTVIIWIICLFQWTNVWVIQTVIFCFYTSKDFTNCTYSMVPLMLDIMKIAILYTYKVYNE